MKQLDHDFQSPLVIAIGVRNMDFIKIAAESDASLEFGWAEFFDFKSTEVCRAVIEQFTPSSLTQLSSMGDERESKSNFCLQMIRALRTNLELRIQTGTESAGRMLQDIKSFNSTTANTLDFYNNRTEWEQVTR